MKDQQGSQYTGRVRCRLHLEFERDPCAYGSPSDCKATCGLGRVSSQSRNIKHGGLAIGR